MENLNLLFNKHYFKGIENTRSEAGKKEFMGELKKRNQEICGVLFSKADYLELDAGISSKDQRFLMRTSYPGLLVGTGYAHEAEAGSDECVKLGFSFDYVSGQPYVPGSSVKGMLKSCFEPDIIGEVLREDLQLPQEQIESIQKDLKPLVSDIFDGRDVFFDAVLRCGNRQGKVMAQDYITPHKGETKNPTPLMMVKVLPEVIFEFRFRLSDSVVNGVTFCAQQKIALFQTLIELFGIGAKTNVGYGILTAVSENDANLQIAQAEEDIQRARQRRKATDQAEFRADQPRQQGRPQPRVQQPPQAQPQRQNQPQQTPPEGKHYCPACGTGLAINGKILCWNCNNTAFHSGKCAICGAATNPTANGNGYQTLCQAHFREYRYLMQT